MTRRKRLTAWLLAGLVLLAAVFVGFEAARAADHVCVGEDCRVCALIATVHGLMRVVSLTIVAAAVVRACRRKSGAPHALRCFAATRTPIRLKVKLLR